MTQLIPQFPSEPINESAVVVFSGGQDSTTCAGWARKIFETVHLVGFDYGQKHSVELEQAHIIAEALNMPFTIIPMTGLAQLADSSLTCNARSIHEPHHRNKKLPSTFVPCRNALFLTMAHACAQKVGAQHLVTGVCQTDYSGYPDCREGFITSLEDTLNLGYETDIKIHTPIMHIDKAETFALADEVGVLDLVLEESHTCYIGDRSQVHSWGCGCSECPACVLRRDGFEKYKAERV